MKHEPIIWEALEYEHKEKNPDWFWAVGILALSGSITAFIVGNVLFGIFIIIAGFALIFFGMRPPERVHYEIGNKNLKIGEYKYPWDTLVAFHIETEEKDAILIESNRPFMPIITLPLPDVSIEHLHEVLTMHLPDKVIKEPFTEKVMHYFGF